jgi:hypothetical protein
MKRVLVASILGLAASVASSYGQASFFFDTYSPAVGMQVEQGGVGVLAAQNVLTDIIWSYSGGAVTGDAGLAIPTSDTPYGNGYIIGPQFTTAANYPTGTPINFTILAWEGASYATASIKGSLSFTDSFTVGNPPAKFGTYGAGLPGTPLNLVPEPTTLALAGLGAASMLIFRKRA